MTVNQSGSCVTMIFRDNDKIIVQGPVTIDNVVLLTQNGIALFEDQPLTIDLEKVSEVDSTIISMLLEWLRATRKHAHKLQFVNMPSSLISLIQLYGMAELIPLPVSPVIDQGSS
ncbi:phospholipid transport system transporter-binding protein [Nitrosomonas ureae]|uniref:Phospholipid transport system transporter-binding protein n=1 Tax=Nitrosomonas ureae TaxID=44577 RepID=A0A285C1Y1_9PROT|nr:STAS domain-containing protein [Nitrosomonas ureae]SNX61136.1 phospholipid transport system transporter-binding protein [Nitrosomonas ureae]